MLELCPIPHRMRFSRTNQQRYWTECIPGYNYFLFTRADSKYMQTAAEWWRSYAPTTMPVHKSSGAGGGTAEEEEEEEDGY